MFIIKILLLIGLIMLLLETNKPFLCAGIYVGFGVLVELLFGVPLASLLLTTVISFVLAAAYFWLLDYIDGMGFIWYVVMVAGFAIGFV